MTRFVYFRRRSKVHARMVGGGGAMHLVIDEGDDVLWCVSTLDRTAGLASRGGEERGYWR